MANLHPHDHEARVGANFGTSDCHEDNKPPKTCQMKPGKILASTVVGSSPGLYQLDSAYELDWQQGEE